MLELTPIQKATLVAERLAGHTFYTGVAGQISQDEFDIELVGEAVSAVLARHDALGLTLRRLADGSVRQVVRESDEPIRLEEIPEASNTVDAFHRVLDEPWDLFGGPVARFLLTRGQSTWNAILAVHHLFADAASMEILSGEIAQTCLELRDGGAVPLPPAGSFVAAARHQISQADTKRAFRGLEYWAQLVGDAPQLTELFSPPPRRRMPRYDSARFQVPEASFETMATRSRAWDVSLEVAALAIVGEVLGRYGAGSDFLVATPATTRLRRYGSPLVGMFANTVVRRLRPGNDLASAAHELAAQSLQGRAWSDVPYAKVIDALAPLRQSHVPPLAQISFHYGTEVDRADRVREAGYEDRVLFRPIAPFAGGFDLSVCFEGYETSPEIVLRFDAERLTSDQVDVLGGAIINRMTSADRSTSTGRPLALKRAPEPVEDGPPATLDLLDGLDPDQVVLVDFDGRGRTAAEMTSLVYDARAAIRTGDVPPRSLVAIAPTLEIGSIVSLLACLAEGHPFVALDPSLSTRDADVAAKLAPAAFLDLEPGETAPTLATSTTSKPRLYHGDAAMLIVTSGSTGEPKVIALSVANIESFIDWGLDFFASAELRYVLATTSPRFDCILFELLLPLTSGSTIVLARSLAEAPTRSPRFHDVTYIATTPTVLRSFMEVGLLPASLLGLTLAGEPCPVDLVSRVFAASSVHRVRNLYGPAEVTTYSVGTTIERAQWDPLAGELERSGLPTVPIGEALRPHANARLAGADGVPCGDDVPGELWLDGPAVGLGYVEGAPPEPAFLIDPLTGRQVFRTADRCAPLRGRGLRFIGRTDRQLKIRGVRIEPAEIEQAIRANPGVVDARVQPGPSERSLVAILDVDESFLGLEDLRSDLGRRLPSYLMPTEFTLVDELPTVGFGKAGTVDLPASPEAHGPTNYLEEALHDVFAHVLSLHHFSRFADFFELGGDSLDMLTALVLIEERLGARLDVEIFVASGSVKQLAALIEDDGYDESYRPVVVLRSGNPETLLCLVHGGPGDLKFAYPLVRSMSSTATICGIRAEGLAADGELRHSIEAMATAYEQALLDTELDLRQVRLVGYCSGGLIALELASKFQHRGILVPDVVLLHTPIPSEQGTGCVELTPERDTREEFEALVAKRSLELELQMLAIGQQDLLKEAGDPSIRVPYFRKRTEVMAAIDVAAATAEVTNLPSSALHLVVAEREDTADKVASAWSGLVGSNLEMTSIDADTVTMSATAELAALLDGLID